MHATIDPFTRSLPPSTIPNPLAAHSPRILAPLLPVTLLLTAACMLSGCGGERSSADDTRLTGEPEAAIRDADATPDLPPFWAIREDPGKAWPMDASSGGDLYDTVKIDGTPCDVAFVAGAVWVATEEGNVFKIDPATRTIGASIAVGEGTRRLIAAHDALWVSANQKLARIDPRTAQIATEITLERTFDGLAAGPAGVYGLAGATAVRIDPATNQQTAKAALGKGGGHGYGEIAVGPDDVWVLDQYSERLHRLDPQSLASRDELEVPDGWVGPLVAGKDVLYVASGHRETAQVLAINPADASVRFAIALDARPDEVLLHGDVLIATPGAFGEFRVYDTARGTLLRELPGEYAEAIAFESD